MSGVLAVSLEECHSLSKFVNKDVLFVFGSRISKIDNIIVRNAIRHYTSRIIATFISRLLNITVYDTQCGCKIFEQNLALKIFAENFISKWLFDVEIFFRIINLYSRDSLKHLALEIPLKSWIDNGKSKVKFSYFFKMWYDFYLIKKRYSKI